MEDVPDQLGAYVEYVLGADSTRRDDTNGINDLHRIHFELTSGKTTRLRLSTDQQKSFWLLWEWWVSYKHIYEVSNAQPLSTYTRHMVEGRCYELKDVSPFTRTMTNLLDYEFGAHIGANNRFVAAREKRRSGRAQVNRVHGPDMTKLKDLCTTRNIDPVVQDYIYSYYADIRSPRIQKDHLSGLDPRCTAGATCDSCPWLPDTDGLPFYLWDREKQCTVEVNQLISKPEYLAISHTWGRWRIPHRSTHVPGVPGWKVPENSIFQVQDLPGILSKFPIDIRYVRFDLVCIPQDRSPRAQTEIARQAAIFKNAKHCMIWLNGLHSWEGLREAVELMAVQSYEGFTCQPPDLKELPTGLFADYNYTPNMNGSTLKINGWFSSLWTLQEICLRPDMWLCNASQELFTVAGGTTPVALNTIVALAGACKRLHDGETALLSGPDPALLDVAWEMVDPREKLGKLIGREGFHRGFLELNELFDRTGLEKLNNMGIEQILILGSNRFCLENRAEAIMSVLGTHEWKRPMSAGGLVSSPPESLVLEQYPLSFLREVAIKEGSRFFNSISMSSASIEEIFTGNHTSQGSLLPFSNLEHSGDSSQEFKFMLNWSLCSEVDNALISDWTIHEDGSVHIPRASILCSTEDARAGELVALIWRTYDSPLCVVPKSGVEDARLREVTVDLRQWCKRYFPSTKNYAVELSTIEGLSRGLLLKEISPGSRDLFKVGNYVVGQINRMYGPLDKTTDHDVHWRVI